MVFSTHFLLQKEKIEDDKVEKFSDLPFDYVYI